MSADFFHFLHSPKTERRTLAVIAVVVLLVQILTMRTTVVYGEPYAIAEYMHKGMGFVYIFPWDLTPSPTCFIPPLYAYFLYALLQAGIGTFGMRIAGLLFFQISGFFLYYFFKRYTKQSLALYGYLLYVAYVPLWLLSEKIDPDGLNILLVTATVFILDRLREAPSWKRWIILGVLLGIQILTRPDILVGIVIFGVWLYYNLSDRRAFVKGYATAIVIALVMVAPWTIRNYRQFGRFVLVSSNSGYNLFLGNNPAATGEFQQGDETPESIAIDSARAAYFNVHPSGVERDSYLFHVAVDWALAHPWEVVKLSVKKFYFHWWLRESAGVYIQAPEWMIDAYNIGSLLLVLLGMIGLWSIPREARSLLVALFVYSTAIAMIFFVQTRHRALKVDPYLIMLSVIGIHRIVSPKRHELHHSRKGELHA